MTRNRRVCHRVTTGTGSKLRSHIQYIGPKFYIRLSQIKSHPISISKQADRFYVQCPHASVQHQCYFKTWNTSLNITRKACFASGSKIRQSALRMNFDQAVARSKKDSSFRDLRYPSNEVSDLYNSLGYINKKSVSEDLARVSEITWKRRPSVNVRSNFVIWPAASVCCRTMWRPAVSPVSQRKRNQKVAWSVVITI